MLHMWILNFLEKKMKLEEYEIICSDCSGSGLDQTRIYKYSCGKCNGEGKLD